MVSKTKAAYRHIMDMSRKRQLALIGMVIIAFLVLVPLLTYAYFAYDIANQERLMNHNNTGVVLLDRHGEEFYRAYNANVASDRNQIDLADMPEHVPQALIAAEDREFYEHDGYSVRGTVAALYGNILSRDPTRYGGSTITQQLARNALLTQNKSYFRKYQELALAIAIERHYSKDQILEMYLNSVYFGEGAFGIENAAQIYFDKPAAQLNTAESSLLVGLLPSPTARSPISGDKEAALEVQTAILGRMADEGFITAEERENLAAQELRFATNQEATEEDSFAIHFAEMVMNELREEYGEERIARSGFRVQTTLDASWQDMAHEAVGSHIAGIESAGAENGAVVAIDPRTGAVRVMVGSVDWSNPEFGTVNMATTPRQPGSSFKPIYYTEALEEEVITPATILEDEPTDFGGYEPENYDLRYRGDITVRRALGNSLNIPSVKVMERLGVETSAAAARRLGLDTVEEADTYGLSLALGTAEVRLLDMTNAYAAFANGGEQYEPNLIENIRNKYERIIYEDSALDSETVMSEEASYLTSSILADDTARAETFGGSLSISRPAAVKTGTTEENVDAWTVGYTPSLATGVWVGNNSNDPMSGIGGSSGAAPIWRTVMMGALAETSIEEFQRPDGVESTLVCQHNGLPAPRQGSGVYTEYFIRGTVPDGQCNVPSPRRSAPEEPEQAPPREEEEAQEPEEEDTDGENTSGGDETEEETEEGTNDDTSGDETDDGSTDDGSTDDGDGSGDTETGDTTMLLETR